MPVYRNIVIPETVTVVGDNAFYGTGWYNNQPNGVLYLDNCFLGYKGNRNYRPSDNFTIVPGTRLIADGAFISCTGLTEITIPESMTIIGASAFAGCSNLYKITSLNPIPPVCNDMYVFDYVPDYCNLYVPTDAKIEYATADVWSRFAYIVEMATVEISTQEQNVTFKIPTTEGAVIYIIDVYSDEAMTQLVATTNYDAEGNIIPASTSLELSINGFENGTYYYNVIAKSSTGGYVYYYSGTFDISLSGINDVSGINNLIEVSRYDIYGRQLTEPTKGINIIKMSDGSTHKVLIK